MTPSIRRVRRLSFHCIMVAVLVSLYTVPALADAEVEALKKELAEQRKLIEQLLAAQGQAPAPAAAASAAPVAGTPPVAGVSQPSISAYGVADVGFNSTSAGQGRKTQFSSGGFSSSRLGVRVDHPLAAALQAVALAEAGVLYDNGVVGNASMSPGINTTPSSGGQLGTGTQLFSRQIFAGLKGDFGSLTLGRQYTGSYIEATGIGSVKGDGLLGYSGGVIPLVGGMPTRLDNSLAYVTPSWQGLSAQLIYTTGSENNVSEPTTSGSNLTTDRAGRGHDIAVFYRQGPLTAAASTWGVNATSYKTTETGLARKRGFQLAANYDFGLLKLAGNVASGKIKGGGYENVTQTLSDANAYGLSVLVPYGPHRFVVAYSHLNDKSALNKDASIYGLGYWYELSTSTKFYAAWGRIQNNAQASYSLVDGGSLVDATKEAGVSPSGFAGGINFTF
ncbi:porin [Ideonella sp. B7]|uniref:porin n=1 Tax=Ideonella benzenivorans TaxID=2831643 RepID=UPI001CEDBC99|nr:porin [Ideonella benzenivorans]MCA6215925.1 porin [Ideonella benzenivorans]